jgi:hypothetical protein
MFVYINDVFPFMKLLQISIRIIEIGRIDNIVLFHIIDDKNNQLQIVNINYETLPDKTICYYCNCSQFDKLIELVSKNNNITFLKSIVCSNTNNVSDIYLICTDFFLKNEKTKQIVSLMENKNYFSAICSNDCDEIELKDKPKLILIKS